jgi:gamma-glutamyltranspeptidase / glutathione hydrolase
MMKQRLYQQLMTVFCLLMILTDLPAQDRIASRGFATRSEVLARQGMAATSQPLATQVALDILKQGGSAVDAAIAANAMLGVVEPMMDGVGGDLFAIIWDAKSGKLHGLNASGRSPESLTPEVFRAKGLKTIPANGPLSISVPGCVDGWAEMHRKFGRLTWSALLKPAIDYARNGFPVSEQVAFDWDFYGRNYRDQSANFRQVYTIDGKIPVKGDIFRNPLLAATLEKIARGGRDAFYKGEIARVIDAYCKREGCYLTDRDLAAHTSDWVEPVSTNYRGYDVWELPPNGQGVTALQMLNILEAYDLKKFGFGSREHIHYFVEAKKLAFEDRAKFYADPAFNRLPLKSLLSKEYAAGRRKLISDTKAGAGYEAGNPALQQGDTVYLTVADRDGNMVSLIQSVAASFGSGMVPDGLGFVLHNRGASYTLEEGHYNAYAPRKRPFHTIIPAFITREGKPFLSFGVMGGAFQPLGHVQIVTNIIDFGMNIQEAGDAPRIDHTGSSQPTGSQPTGSPTGSKVTDGGQILLESGHSYETIRELMKMGHKVGYSLGLYGGYQAIKYDSRLQVYYGATESRKDGQAAGY